MGDSCEFLLGTSQSRTLYVGFIADQSFVLVPDEGDDDLIGPEAERQEISNEDNEGAVEDPIFLYVFPEKEEIECADEYKDDPVKSAKSHELVNNCIQSSIVDLRR